MKCFLLSAASASLVLGSTSGSLVSMGENPVKKVVSLLQEMQTQMQKDAKSDSAAFKKMECYCRNHREEKSAAVVDA